jgi:hypothetical protein
MIGQATYDNRNILSAQVYFCKELISLGMIPYSLEQHDLQALNFVYFILLKVSMPN